MKKTAPAELSLALARAMTLRAQGLDAEAPFGSGDDAVLAAIERLGYVQIDTISVVERAHHHVIWSRVPDYVPAKLGALVSQGKVFEYWSHAAAFLPMRDFRYSLLRKERIRKKGHWFVRERKVMKQVLDRIKAEGPLQAKDFEAPEGRKGGPWFEWKPAKKALEQLFMQGDLMIRERRGFQKVYDLTDRVLPADVDRSMPTLREFARHLILGGLEAHGFASELELRYLRRGLETAFAAELKSLLKEGQVQELSLPGAKSRIYVLSSVWSYWKDHAEAASANDVKLVHILSPFDNLVIQRKRLKTLFDFDYLIECYVPEPKRKFGYFCLPLMVGHEFVGRIDAKAYRDERVLKVEKLFVEPRFRKPQVREWIAPKLEAFARFNGCERVRF